MKKRQSKSLLFWLTALIVIGLIAYASYYWLVVKQNNHQQAQVLTSKVTLGNLENLVTATGILQPKEYVDVGAQVSGQLKVLHVEVGTQVERGDLMAEIDATVFLAKVDASRAQLRYQKAQLKERHSQLTLAEINYQRAQRLFKKQATTEEAMLTTEASLRSSKAQIEMIQAQIDQTESSLRADEANLEYAQIYAPMDGTVVSIAAKRGQTLNANQQAPVILRIADLSTMTVQTQVSEADISKLKAGMQVYFTALGNGNKRWEGQLKIIEPTPEVVNNVVLYNALFDIPNAERLLMSQMTAQVFFIVDSAKDALLVPVSALKYSTPNSQTAEVMVVSANGAKEVREVQVGVSNRVQAQILSGLKEGDTIITNNTTKNAPRNMGSPGRPMGLGLG